MLAGLVAGSIAVVAGPSLAHNGIEHEHEVTIKGFTFVPERLTVRVGDTVTFTNEDVAPHTATALDLSWDTEMIGKGESAAVTIAADMELDYFCRFHPQMKGGFDLVEA